MFRTIFRVYLSNQDIDWASYFFYFLTIILYMCVVAAFIFVPYWLHPRLVDISFSPISLSLAERTQLSDLLLNTSQTFVLCMSPMWAQQPWDGLNLSRQLTAEVLSVFPPLTQTCIDAVSHTYKLTSLPFPSELVICAKALGVVGEVSAVIWWHWGGPNAWFLSTLILSLHPSWKSFPLLSLQL